MKERPILFSGPMVRALLAGTKTQTRRVVKAARDPNIGCWMSPGEIALDWPTVQEFISPYGQRGDRLWVRESWAPNTGSAGGFLYRAEHGAAASFNRLDLKTGVWTHSTSRWWPSIHMPRAASRLTLEITGVRVERLQDISEADARAEGLIPARGPLGSQVWEYSGKTGGQFSDPRVAFHMLWESINGPGSWDANPWVWVVEFQRITNLEAAR